MFPAQHRASVDGKIPLKAPPKPNASGLNNFLGSSSPSGNINSTFLGAKEELQNRFTGLRSKHGDWSEHFDYDPATTEESVDQLAAGETVPRLGSALRPMWKFAQLDLAKKHASGFGVHELAIAGFCGGYAKAMMPLAVNYFDRLWTDLHCLKEEMVERWLAYRVAPAGGGASGAGAGDHAVSGGASAAVADGFRKNLCGVFADVAESDFEEAAGAQVRAVVARNAASTVAGGKEQLIAKVQSCIIQAQW